MATLVNHCWLNSLFPCRSATQKHTYNCFQYGKQLHLCRLFTDRLINFAVGLTDQDLRTVNGPISEVPFLKCATHGRLGQAQIVSLNCEHPRYTRRRYLFVAASVAGFFHQSEIEVFDGELRSLFSIFTFTSSWYISYRNVLF